MPSATPVRKTRAQQQGRPALDPFLAQHLAVGWREVSTEAGPSTVTVNDGESPLAWLARRRRADGTTLIDAVQFAAGERLREDFTRAQLMARTTVDWGAAAGGGRRGTHNGATAMTDVVVAARQRVRHALDAVGPEFAGFLLDVCCFLKGLEQVEHERRWPARSAKLVLQLGLDCLARHYGLRREIRGADRPEIGAWNGDDVLPGAGEE
jgi:hypothetical protein